MNHSRVFVQFFCGAVLIAGCGLAAAAQPPTDGHLAVSPAELEELISLLGDDEFRVREAATERLIQMGTAIITGLQSGGRHHDREIRYRCERILRAVILRDRQERIDALLSGNESQLGELPAWPHFREAVGEDTVCRQLYVEMLRNEWDLLDQYEASPDSIDNEIANRCLAINEAQRVFRQGIPLGTILTVLFLASQDGVAVPDVTGQQIYSLLYQASFRSAIAQSDRRDVMRSILGRWIERDGGQWTTHYALNLSLEHGLTQGLKPAARVINQRGGQGQPAVASHIRQYGILVIAKLGGPEHVELLTQLFDDETVCSRQQVNKTVTFQTQVRDIALAARIHLAGEDPRDFGFDRVQPNSRNVFNPTSLGFPSDESRKDAFAKWNAFQSAIEAKPPSSERY